eukprot:2069155-Amphidinium_carterae.1
MFCICCGYGFGFSACTVPASRLLAQSPLTCSAIQLTFSDTIQQDVLPPYFCPIHPGCFVLVFLAQDR